MTHAHSQSFVTERTNNNDNARIDLYFREARINPAKMKGNQKLWCAVFTSWAFRQCTDVLDKLKINLAAVASFDRLKKWIRPRGQPAKPADLVTYKPWSHIELVDEWHPNPKMPVFYTTGGNTTAGNDKHGVYTRIPRRKSTVKNIIHPIADA